MRNGAKTKIAQKRRSGLARVSPRTTKGCAVPFRSGQFQRPIASKRATSSSLARALQGRPPGSCHSLTQFGARFSRNACKPSTASAVVINPSR